jgi:CubicO group peptidase (beta-lactamase class C family)
MSRWFGQGRLLMRLPIIAAAIFIISSFESCTFMNDLLGLRPRSIPLGDYSYTIEHTNRLVRRTMRKLDIPGLAVALIDDQEVVWDQAYGVADLESSTPVSLDTVFKAGSIAKVFTGLEVMRMYEEGLIDLDAPIATYLPEFTIQTRWPEADPITIRDILAHRSGIPRNDSLPLWHWDSRPEIFTAITATASELHQAYPAGHRYKYSNFAYNVLGRLIEVVRDIDPPATSATGGFPYYMEQEIFAPLGMMNSGFGSTPLLYGVTDQSDMAVGYYAQNGKNQPYNQFDIIDIASGNLHTTMYDLEKFMHFLLAGGVSPANDETGSSPTETGIIGSGIIESETLESMYEVQYATPDDPQTNGITWFTDSLQLSELMVFHTGTNLGAISYFAFLPDRKIGLAFLTNADLFETVQNQLAVEILSLMLETKFGIRPSDRIKPDIVDVDTETLKQHEGRYIADGEKIDVTLYSNGLRARYRGMNLVLNPVGSSSFRVATIIPGIDEVAMSFAYDEIMNSRYMILTVGGSYHIVCPEYPVYDESDELPQQWTDIAGTYTVSYRHPSVYSDTNPDTVMTISIDDNLLSMSDGKVLLPLNETRMQIVGGIYDGEIIEIDEERHTLTWQHLIYTGT